MKNSDIRITPEIANELKSLAARPSNQIDFTDIPEILNWSHAVVGKFYRPIKQPVNLRVDADVLAWFKSLGKKYQSKMNEALRSYMHAHHSHGKEHW